MVHDQTKKTILVLGGSGQLVPSSPSNSALEDRKSAAHLAMAASCHSIWDDVDTYEGALTGIDRVYLVAPTMRVRYVEPVAKFLDLPKAPASHTSHCSVPLTVTRHLRKSMWLHSKVKWRDISGLTHTILRPAWVMQNFADQHFPIVEDLLVVPSAGGTEAFVDALDIAEVAAATLSKPEEHAGATCSLARFTTMTLPDEAARTIASVSGRPIKYLDCDQETWINGAVATGVPPITPRCFAWLTGSIISGSGSTPTGDVAAVIGRPATSLRNLHCATPQSGPTRRTDDQVHRGQFEFRGRRALLSYHSEGLKGTSPTARTTSTCWLMMSSWIVEFSPRLSPTSQGTTEGAAVDLVDSCFP